MPASVSFIGSGKVATTLAHAFRNKGVQVASVFSRNSSTAQTLADAVGANVAASVDEIKASDYVIVAVKDDQIASVVKDWKSQATVIHTSGASELSLLEGVSRNIAVAWPVHTFTNSSQVDFQRVPVFVEGNLVESTQSVMALFSLLSQNIHEADSTQRLYLHTCAVFANNFSNHCMAIAEKMLEAKGYGFEVLRPVMEAHLQLLASKNPSVLQTGPASRKDKEVLRRQMELLQEFPAYRDLYRALSESIMHEKL